MKKPDATATRMQPPPSPRAVIFVGPSMPGLKASPHARLDIRPPAKCGDIIDALADGYTHIGIIDGYFESQLAVWHKEILFALDQGAVVLGGASMGALRAAELNTCGMIGVGLIYDLYASGVLTRDDEVAVAHGPAELGYMKVSESLINMRLTLDRARAQALLTPELHARLAMLAESLFFKQRTWEKLFELAADIDSATLSILQPGLAALRVDQKNIDARQVCEQLVAGVQKFSAAPFDNNQSNPARPELARGRTNHPLQFVHTEYLRNLLTDKGWTVTWHGTSYQTTRPTPETLMTLT